MDAEVFERMAAVEDGHWWFVARRRILARMLGELALPGTARILEAGCGTGGNLALLRRFGDVQAFEPSAQARALAGAKWPYRIKDGALPERVPFEGEDFDLVVALDVIEHLGDDLASVQALARCLAPGGQVLVTVPAYPFLWSTHDERHHHKRRYTARRLRRLLEDAGLLPTRVSYFNTLLFPLALAVRAAGRLGLPTNEEAVPGHTLNQLLQQLFALERHLLPRVRLPFGLSLLAIGRRPG